MDKNRIPGILAPLLVGAAIVLSWRYEKPSGPVELPAATEAPRALGQIQSAYESALAPGAPGYEYGLASAPVTVLELADFGCRYCGSFARETFPQLMNEFVKGGKVRWRYVPFVMGMFPNGKEATLAAECAAQQGESNFWRMHDALYARQSEWKDAADPATLFTTYAESGDLDAARFTTCWNSGEVKQRIAASNRLAEDLGVRATPTFFINGMRVEGALPVEEFRAILNEALLAGR